jgi:hypothetical protein
MMNKNDSTIFASHNKTSPRYFFHSLAFVLIGIRPSVVRPCRKAVGNQA